MGKNKLYGRKGEVTFSRADFDTAQQEGGQGIEIKLEGTKVIILHPLCVPRQCGPWKSRLRTPCPSSSLPIWTFTMFIAMIPNGASKQLARVSKT